MAKRSTGIVALLDIAEVIRKVFKRGEIFPVDGCHSRFRKGAGALTGGKGGAGVWLNDGWHNEVKNEK